MAVTDLKRREMVEALRRGPQSIRPPQVDRQETAELARSIRLALSRPGPVRDQMEAALLSVRAERR